MGNDVHTHGEYERKQIILKNNGESPVKKLLYIVVL